MKKPEKRQHPRIAFLGTASISMEKNTVDVSITNMSMGGLHFHCNGVFDLGGEVCMHVKGAYRGKQFEEMVSGRIVTVYRSRGENSYGLQFALALDSERQPFLVRSLQGRKKRGVLSFLRDSFTHSW